MILYMSISLGLVFFLLLIPERYWEYLYNFYQKQRERVLQILQKRKPGSNVRSGELLLYELTMLSSDLSVGKAGSSIELHQYKFYTNLLEELLSYKRQFGIPLLKILVPIRDGIKKDYQFEKKIQNELWGGIVQFIFVSLITWVFSFMVYKMVGLKSSFFTKMIILVLQISGIFFYGIIYQSQKRNKFIIFEIYFKVLFSLSALMEVGLASSKVLKNSQYSSIFDFNDKQFAVVSKKLSGLIEVYKNNGHQIKNDLEGLVSEVYFLQEERFLQFIKFLGLLKFSLLCLFFLSAYFIYLFTLFSLFLME